MSGDLHKELASGATGEASRLASVVEALEAQLDQAEAEAAIVAEWDAERIDVLRQGLRLPRFADVEAIGAELARAQQELDAVQALRRRLSQHEG
jgi:hypothetical protein